MNKFDFKGLCDPCGKEMDPNACIECTEKKKNLFGGKRIVLKDLPAVIVVDFHMPNTSWMVLIYGIGAALLFLGGGVIAFGADTNYYDPRTGFNIINMFRSFSWLIMMFGIFLWYTGSILMNGSISTYYQKLAALECMIDIPPESVPKGMMLSLTQTSDDLVTLTLEKYQMYDVENLPEKSFLIDNTYTILLTSSVNNKNRFATSYSKNFFLKIAE